MISGPAGGYINIGEWIEKTLRVEQVNSVDFMYDEMESQSAHCLPVIYQPFDPAKRSHWCDRGWLFDFLYATRCLDGKMLDFGPGDGWPSLIMSSYVREVIGVDGSQRRVAECTKNAERLGIRNARFIHVLPGDPLPFDSGSFDSVVAASSIEQTPDPMETLSECYRVLKPGARFRICYEGLSRYRNGKEKELFFESNKRGNCALTLYDRNIEEERAVMYTIHFSVACRQIFPLFLGSGERIDRISYDSLPEKELDQLLPVVEKAKKCMLTHPSGRTLAGWMRKIGFRRVLPTRSGAQIAGEIFDAIPALKRPKTMEEVDMLIRQPVKEGIEEGTDLEGDPLITCVK